MHAASLCAFLNSTLFAEITVVEVEDLLQLPSVRVKTVYADYKNQNLDLPWNIFRIVELTKVRR